MVYPAIKDEAALILRGLAPLRLIVLAASLYVAPYPQVDMVKLANGLLIDNPFSCQFDPFHISEPICDVENDVIGGIFLLVIFKQEPCCTDIFRYWFL
jgi:hypothetical protein